MSDKSNGLIVQPTTAIRLSEMVAAPIASLLDDGVRDNSLLLGFDAKSPEGEAWLFAMEDDASEEPGDYRDKPFPMISWGAKRVPLYDDQSRDYLPVVRVVLIGDGGRTLAFTSDGVVASLDMIRALKGDGPFQPPLNVIVREVTTRRGYRLYKLQPHGLLETTATRRKR